MSTESPVFLHGGGHMGARIRAFDWAATPLGKPAQWPAPLKTLVSVMLASNQPMFVAWGPGRALLYNDLYVPILGAKQADALGRDLLDVWHEIREHLAPLVDAVQRGESVRNSDIEFVLHRNGYAEEAHFSFFYSPVRDDTGEVAGLFCACNEITAQVTAERALKASEARYRGVLNNMGEAFALMDHDFTILDVNEAGLRLQARPRESLVGRSHWEVYPDTYDSHVGQLYRRVADTGMPDMLEHCYTFEDGRRMWLELRAYPVEDGVAAFFRDITARRETAEAAALAAERVQLALDAGAIVGTWVWTVSDNRVVADARFARSFGLDAAQCLQGVPLERVVESIHPDDAARVQAAIADAVAAGGAYRCEYRVRQDDGIYRWVEANGRVETDADGRAVRFPGVLLDIEDRRRTQAERDAADALLRTFIDVVPGVVYAKDRDGRLRVASRGIGEVFGRPVEALIGVGTHELVADPAEAAAVAANDERIMSTGVAERLEENVRLADGTSATWLSVKAPLRDDAGRVVGLVGSSVDITDRKRMEDALRRSEQRSALALNVAQLGMWTWDLRSGEVTADARTRQICGLDAEPEALTLDHIAGRVHPDDWPRVQAALQAALAPGGGHYGEEFRWLHADGRVVWTLSRGHVTFEQGEAATMIGSVIDVTERRHLLDTLRQTDRRKDEFLAMLAHELRNPLAPIGTAAQLLRMAPDDAERVRQAAQIIERQVGHMTEMVDDLLDVSRVTRGLVELDREAVDLRTVTAAAIEQVQPLVHARGHRLVVESPAAPVVVMGDRHRLVQVVSNLLNNAAKYTPPGGRIELVLEREGEQARVHVSDTGIGIDAPLLPHVFDLFTQAERTPDRSQGGLGIGLALVRSILQLHGGTISAHSAGPGQGSTFAVALPLSAQTEATPSVEVRPRPALHRKTVLVVDDNRDAADTLAVVLQMLGHDAHVAGSGREALAMAAARADWDAFIVDIGMPDMTGYELVGLLREAAGARPAHFIALTGYGQPHDRRRTREAGFDHHLVKPADVEQVRGVLEQAPARVADPQRA